MINLKCETVLFLL